MKNLFKQSLFVLALGLSSAHADTSSEVDTTAVNVQLAVNLTQGAVNTVCAVTVSNLTMSASVTDIQNSTIYSTGGVIDYSDCTSGANMLAHGDSFTMKLTDADASGVLRQVDGTTSGASTADSDLNKNLTVDFYLTAGSCSSLSSAVPSITINRNTTQTYSLCAVDKSGFGDLKHVGVSNPTFTFNIPVEFTNI